MFTYSLNMFTYSIKCAVVGRLTSVSLEIEKKYIEYMFTVSCIHILVTPI